MIVWFGRELQSLSLFLCLILIFCICILSAFPLFCSFLLVFFPLFQSGIIDGLCSFSVRMNLQNHSNECLPFQGSDLGVLRRWIFSDGSQGHFFEYIVICNFHYLMSFCLCVGFWMKTEYPPCVRSLLKAWNHYFSCKDDLLIYLDRHIISFDICKAIVHRPMKEYACFSYIVKWFLCWLYCIAQQWVCISMYFAGLY